MKNKKAFIVKLSAIVAVILIAFTLTACSSVTTKTTVSQNLYEQAVSDGYTGSLDDWLLDILKSGDYDSIYDMAISKGLIDSDTTLEEFIASLKGEAGSTSVQEASAYAINSIVSVYSAFTFTTSGGMFGGHTQTTSGTSAGSGVIIDDNKTEGEAYIITNYHVVYSVDSNEKISTDIYLFLYGMEYDKYKIEATYIGGSMTYDIAVLKIDSDIYTESGAYPVTVADSQSISVGDSVIAIGNPEAYGISATTGIVSVASEVITMTAADDETKVDFRVIRYDASVNAGNSGGGLFNNKGELIGIVNAKTVDSEIEGMCYAIPSNIAVAIANKIISTCNGVTTTIRKTVLGSIVEVASSSASYDSETKTTSITQTISISSITSGSASYGLLSVDDVLINITYNDVTYSIDSLYDIEDVLLNTSVGDTISFYILRGSEYKTVSIELTKDVAVA